MGVFREGSEGESALERLERLDSLGIRVGRVVFVPGDLLNRWNDFADVYNSPQEEYRMMIVSVSRSSVDLNYIERDSLYGGERPDYQVFPPHFAEEVEEGMILFDDEDQDENEEDLGL